MNSPVDDMRLFICSFPRHDDSPGAQDGSCVAG